MATDRVKPEPSLQSVLDDMEMYQVLLKSVDDSAEPDDTLRTEYQEKLASLQQELDTLQPLPTWDTMSSDTSSPQAEIDARSLSTGDVGDEVSSTTSYNNLYPRSPNPESSYPATSRQANINERTASHAFLGDIVADRPVSRSSQTTAFPTRKRPFSGEHDYSFSKSRRATPSPAISAATTPTSTASEFDDLLTNLLGDDVRQDYKDYEKEQREWDARQEQERRDAELARTIQESWNSPMASSKPQPSFTIQTSIGSASGSMGAMPPPPVPKIQSESHLPYFQSEQSTIPNLKDEQSTIPNLKSEQSPAIPGSFPNMWHSGGEDSSSSHSSDIEEISPRQFIARVKLEPTYTSYGQPLNNPQSMFIPQFGGSSVYNSFFGSNVSAGYGTYSGITGSQNLAPSGYTDFLGTASNYMSSIYSNAQDLLSGQFGGSSKSANIYPVYNDPSKTHEELKTLLANIRPDEEVKPESREGTPEAMKCTLMEHQKLGLTWMKSMEDSSSKGGILADDMGLGKTVQALSLIVSRKSNNPVRKTTLIVAPVALMGQWAREISRLLKRGRHSLTVETLHANTRHLPWSTLREKDVVLTTYGTLSSEVKRKHTWEEKLKRVPNAQPSRNEQLPLLGEKSKWYRVILDEAQWIKNKSTKAAVSACHLQAEFRWCLTGTPMQNSVDELYSLIRFLKIAPYNSLEKFTHDFTRPLKAKQSYSDSKDNAMQQLQALCKAIMLRRTKQSKIDGQPILQLPEKTIDEEHAVFSKDEQEFYQCLENSAQITFNKYLAAGTVGRNYSNALVLLLRLRQACCHPHLIKDIALETGASPEGIDKLANAHTLPREVVERIKQVEAFECPICFDAAINSLIFNPCGHPSCNECFDRLATRARANADNETGSDILCPNCRGKVDPAKLTDFRSFKKAFGSDGEEDGAESGTKDDDEETETDSDSDSEDSDDDGDDDGDLAGFIVPDDEVEFDSDDGDSKKSTGKIQSDKLSTKKEEGESSGKHRRQKRKSKGKGKGKASSTKHLSLAQLRKEGLKNKAAKKRYLRRLEKNFQTSAKIDKAVELLEAIERRGTNEKTIVFSQFTSLLDLLEVPLSQKGVSYKRYDGSMKPAEREESVMAFTDDPRYTVMLVSLKAGNSGLNLTAASQVIMFDPHWNW